MNFINSFLDDQTIHTNYILESSCLVINLSRPYGISCSRTLAAYGICIGITHPIVDRPLPKKKKKKKKGHRATSPTNATGGPKPGSAHPAPFGLDKKTTRQVSPAISLQYTWSRVSIYEVATRVRHKPESYPPAQRYRPSVPTAD